MIQTGRRSGHTLGENLCLSRASFCKLLYTGGCECVLMCIPAAWPVTDIGGLLRCVVFVSGVLGLAPITHRKQAPGPSFTLNTQEIHTGNRVSTPGARFTPSSILLSSPTDPSGGLAGKSQLHTQLTAPSAPRTDPTVFPVGAASVLQRAAHSPLRKML